MNSHLSITVTTAEGQPTLKLPAHLSHLEIQERVRDQFGFQKPNGAVALPHSYCGGHVPPLPHEDAPTGHAGFQFLTRPGHLRVV